MSTKSIFKNMFAKSPIKPIQNHIDAVTECSELLIPFFEECAKNNWDQANEIRKNISSLERRADELKREIRLVLPRGLFMPMDRSELLKLVNRQDKIANNVKDISGRVYGRQLKIPLQFSDDFLIYTARCIDAVKQAQTMIHEFDELLELGFRGKEVDIITQMILELESIEDDTDSIQIKLRRQLFALENDLSPVDVIFLYQIIETIGSLADHAEVLGTHIELMLIRS
ncbi:MAG: TIGR00153 family protein [Psychromonas sp.]|nr:TIGR00153 family protein [Psychromonas sp.]